MMQYFVKIQVKFYRAYMINVSSDEVICASLKTSKTVQILLTYLENSKYKKKHKVRNLLNNLKINF